MHHYFGGGYRVGLWLFLLIHCAASQKKLQPWNSLQHTTFLQYYKKKSKNHYLQLWNKEE